jgi:hypothetical protein
VLFNILYAAAITWENKKRAKQAHDLNLTESEKTDLGVSSPVKQSGVNGPLLTDDAGLEPRVQVHALNEKFMKDDMSYNYIPRVDIDCRAAPACK